jgi:hypothetical protein
MLTVAEYETYDAMGLAGLIATKQTSVSEVLETAISHVEAKNPVLNAVVHKIYDAARLTISRALPVGPLAGVPFLIKDVGTIARERGAATAVDCLTGLLRSTMTRQLSDTRLPAWSSSGGQTRQSSPWHRRRSPSPMGRR